ncbi:MAG: FAD-dependent oxidoreductase, partial [Proteobacteria bacterium]|nr:FAD-dependent oxidoreductase [Pseudomonadota bacterium]MBU1741562.1 FAD-dependent oxidoreductase [Pseudomonadota bacterium]
PGLAEGGLRVYLVEREAEIGGVAGKLERTFPTPKCQMTVTCLGAPRGGGWAQESRALADGFSSNHMSACLYCCTTPRLVDAQAHPSIEVMTRTEVAEVSGRAGDFVVNLDRAGREVEVKVGAIMVAVGFSVFDPGCAPEIYGYGRLPNVVTSLEHEESARLFGANLGQTLRPSDQAPAGKVAWLQCVGSRDLNACDNPYCSSVCCMYAVKESTTVKQRAAGRGDEVDCAVFYMDQRSQEKGAERSYQWARDEMGVRFIHARVHGLEAAEGDRIKIVWAEDDGEVKHEKFDLVVLSVGLHPDPATAELADKLGLEVDEYGFIVVDPRRGMATTREGVHACGAAVEPKDISGSVVQALAAAEAVMLDLKEACDQTETAVLGSSEGEPKIAVFVEAVGDHLDHDALVDFSAKLPGVVVAEKVAGGEYAGDWPRLRELVADKNIDRLVVAAGSPRWVSRYLRRAAAAAGLNPYLTEVAPIRNQVVFGTDPNQATDRTRDLIRAAVARVGDGKPAEPISVTVDPRALVIGGGPAGMRAALDLASAGLFVTLVEKSDRLGGTARSVNQTWQGEPVAPIIEDLIDRVEAAGNINVLKKATLKRAVGYAGHFVTTLEVEGEERPVEHGAVIVATGGREYEPSEYLYGQSDRVMTALQFDAMLRDKPDEVAKFGQVAFIQCVGSREPDRPYCSQLCCTHSMGTAIALKDLHPDLDVYILYRDVTTHGLREKLYQEAREKGVIFVRFDLDSKPEVTASGDGLEVKVVDRVAAKALKLRPDALVLAAAVLPAAAPEVCRAYNVGLGPDGFFQEAHPKWEPVDLAVPGVFAAGLALYPKGLEDALTQARAAAGRALSLLGRKRIVVSGVVAEVDPDQCARCCTCVRACPFGLPFIGELGVAEIEALRCYGCGICASECPGKAIGLRYCEDGQIIAQTDALGLGVMEGK